MKIEIIETTTVSPSRPPFVHDHILPLSHLDTDPNLHLTFRYLRAYAPTRHPANADPFAVISGALSEALVHYYPFAGTLRRRTAEPGSRIELHCATADKGVLLIRANAGCTLASVNYLEDPNVESVDRLAPGPYPDPIPDKEVANPLVLQVTVFACGGFCLGASVHHAMCDGIGATQFFAAMAAIARGADRPPIDPVWERAELLGPRDPPRVEFRFQEIFGSEGSGGVATYARNGGSVRRECFDVSEETMDRFKTMIWEQSGVKFTTFEALGAFIWQARVRASDFHGEEVVTFVYPINIRKLLSPPLPSGYWGNGCVAMYVKLTAWELTKQSIWETARLIKQSKFDATDEYARSFVDFQELHDAQGIAAGPAVSAFTDWRHLGHSAVDFGWGAPVTVLPLSRNLLGSVEPCFFLPHSSKSVGKEGFKVLVWLKEEAAPGFRVEMENFCSQQFGTSR